MVSLESTILYEPRVGVFKEECLRGKKSGSSKGALYEAQLENKNKIKEARLVLLKIPKCNLKSF